MIVELTREQGGAGNEQLDILSMSNVVNPVRYYAHALCSCLFLGMSTLSLNSGFGY